MIDYEISYKDAQGNLKSILNNDEIELDITLKTNDASAMTLTLPCCPNYSFDSFPIDSRLEICASCDCQDSFLVGQSPFFVERREMCEDASGNCAIKLTCTNATGLLSRRIVAYKQDAANQGTATDVFADDLIKQIFRQNGGDPSVTGNYSVSVDPARDWSSVISTEANESAAPKVTQTYGGQTLLAAMQAIAQESENKGTRLFFGIYQDECCTGKLEFRTSINQPGQVRDMIASPDNESLGAYCISEDVRNSGNRVYTTDGNNAVSITDSANLATTLASDPFGLHEVTTSTTGTAANSGSSAGEAELARLSKVLSINGSMTDYVTKFGCDYNFGDRIKAVIDGYEFDVVIDSLHLNSSKGQITIEPTLSSQSAKSASGIGALVQQVKNLQAQLAKLVPKP